MKKIQLSLIILITFLVTACGSGELAVNDAWARPALAGQTGAVYFVIDNPGEADTLLSVRTDASASTEMHMSMMVSNDSSDQNMDSMSDSSMGDMSGEVMTMVQQDNVPVPAKGKVAFEPGGLHVMLLGLKDNLVEGQTIEVTLNFEKAGPITVQVPVTQK